MPDTCLMPDRERLARTLPSGAVMTAVTMADGATIRTARWHTPAPRGTILFLQGRSEFIEKYSESYHLFLSWGVDVATWDWRGQGRSSRWPSAPERGHIDSFEAYVSDGLALLRDWLADAPRPRLLVGHSMGGHLALRLALAAPDLIDGLVLLAPMLGLNAGPLPPRALHWIVRAMVQRGKGEDYAPSQGPVWPSFGSAFRQNRLTGDLARFADELWWARQYPELVVGGATYGWVNAAFDSMAALASSEALTDLSLPLTALIAQGDRVVDPEAALRLLGRIPGANIIPLPDARHELLREREPIFTQAHDHIRQAFEALV